MIGVLCALGLLGAMSVLVSAIPRVFAWPLALLALGYGAWLARQEASTPDREFVWPGEGPVTLDGIAVDEASLQWRGPLAFLAWRDPDGRIQRLSWWPDTLGNRARRELRLAVDQHAASRGAPWMAG